MTPGLEDYAEGQIELTEMGKNERGQGVGGERELTAKREYLGRLQTLTYGGTTSNKFKYVTTYSQSTLCATIYNNVTFSCSSHM